MMAHGSQRSYLFFYNSLSCILWLHVFSLLARSVIQGTISTSFFSDHQLAICLAQFIAVFEIVHAALGWVSSPVLTVAIQVGSRFLVLFGILNQVKSLQTHWVVLILLFAWASSEIPRYLYYAMNLCGAVPYWLLWMRYSFFLVLYPLGISSELFCIFNGMSLFKETGKWSIEMPNQFNFAFSYYYLLIWILILYVPGSPHMYLHMYRQRAKHLAPKTNKMLFKKA